jgi:hypothetical protein
MWAWEQIWEKAGGVNNTKAYVTNDDTAIDFSVGVTLVNKFVHFKKLIY